MKAQQIANMKAQLLNSKTTLSVEDENKLQMMLISLIEDGNWTRLKRAFRFRLLIDAAQSLHVNPALFGANILHIVLRNQPPIDIIDLILQKFPETPFQSDSVGRYPLHVASSLGISDDIVITIAGANPQACMKQDLDGRTPLHFACDTSRALYEEDMSCHDNLNHLNFTTILYLASVAPSSVHLEDCDEMNPIEHALLSNASKRVVALLQNVSVLQHHKIQGKPPRVGVVKNLEKLIASLEISDDDTDASDVVEAKSFS